MSTALRDARDEDDFAERAASLLEATGKVMCLYIPDRDQKIEMLVGRETKATVSFQGPITQEAISDVLAHLVFYKKYFPKTAQEQSCETPNVILDRFRAILAEDRAARGYKVAPEDRGEAAESLG